MALALARKYKPQAITLDMKLPDRDGWTVLDRLKHDPQTSHIPVHIISWRVIAIARCSWEPPLICKKPVTPDALTTTFETINDFVERPVKKLLVVKVDAAQRASVVELIGNTDVKTTAVGNGQAALAALKDEKFDCLVLDLKLPDMSGFDLIESIQRDLGAEELPIVVYTAKI